MDEKSSWVYGVIEKIGIGLPKLFWGGVSLVEKLFHGHENWMAVIIFVELLVLVVALVIRPAWGLGITHPDEHDLLVMEANVKVDKYMIVKRLLVIFLMVLAMSLWIGVFYGGV